MPLPKIGEPIPLGIIKTERAESQGMDVPSTSDQIDALRQELESLRTLLADVGRATSATVRAHPIISASVISLGLWALIGLASRRAIGRWHWAKVTIKFGEAKWKWLGKSYIKTPAVC